MFHLCWRLPERNTFTRTAVHVLLLCMCFAVWGVEANNGKCLLNYLYTEFNIAFIHDYTVLPRQVLGQSSSSSRARSKRVKNQTMFDVPDPLVVHVLLLNTWVLSMMIFASLILGILSVTVHVLYVPLFDQMRSVGPGRCLIVYWYYSVLQCHRCAFFPFPGFFIGATTTIITIFTRFTYTASQSHVLTDGFICNHCNHYSVVIAGRIRMSRMA
jgi:hypothetical protein